MIELSVSGHFRKDPKDKTKPSLPLSLYIGVEKPMKEKIFDDAKACCDPETFKVSIRARCQEDMFPFIQLLPES